MRSDCHFRPNFESLRVEIPPNGECRCRRPRKPSLSFSIDADRERGGKGELRVVIFGNCFNKNAIKL